MPWKTMKDVALEWEHARSVIRNACQMLADARASTPVFARSLDGLEEDFAVLLRDAARMFCRAVSRQHDEPPDSRWSPEIAERLLAHPERCDETLARVEEASAAEILEAQFASV